MKSPARSADSTAGGKARGGSGKPTKPRKTKIVDTKAPPSPEELIHAAVGEILTASRADAVPFLRGQAQGMVRLAFDLDLIDTFQRDVLRKIIDNAAREACTAGLQQMTEQNQRDRAAETSARVERDFWVEQSRTLQNQVQQWQRMYADLLAHVQRGVTDDGVRASLSEAREALAEPVTGVEAVRALVAETSGRAQGNYTAVRAPKREALASEYRRTKR